MGWLQFAIFFITIIGFLVAVIALFWASRNDMNAYRADATADRRDILNLIRSIQAEIKDFHGRLCTIEERNKGK